MKNAPGMDFDPQSATSSNEEIPFPTDWKSAVSSLVAARLTIMGIEGKKAAQVAVKKLALILVAAVLFILALIFLVAGTVTAVAAATGLPWYWIALAAAAILFIIALILLACAKKSGGDAFPLTRAELQKDREWIKKCQNNKTSSN